MLDVVLGILYYPRFRNALNIRFQVSVELCHALTQRLEHLWDVNKSTAHYATSRSV
jgi:hypothetical protein